MGDHGKLQPREVLALRGLRIPRTLLRRLREYGILCQPSISRAGKGILSGYESGGGVHNLGAYCGYCSPDGGLLAWTHNLESTVSRNGLHAIIVTSDVVRIHVLRNREHLEILITQHTVRPADLSIVNKILLRSRGVMQGTGELRNSAELDLSAIEFRDESGSPLEIPYPLRSATLRVIKGSLCLGCRHCHSLLPLRQASDDVSQSDLKPPLPSIEDVLADLATSGWMKSALLGAISRDPVDAANDAELLYQLLDARCQDILKSHQPCLAADHT